MRYLFLLLILCSANVYAAKIIEYQIGCAWPIGKLAPGINQKIAEGWQPFGSPFIYNHSSYTEVCQSVIRYENQTVNPWENR